MWKRREHADEQDAAASSGSDDADEVLLCLRCERDLKFVAEQDFHEGTRAWGFLLGDLGELMTGGTKLEMWACASCGQVEFFLPGIG